MNKSQLEKALEAAEEEAFNLLKRLVSAPRDSADVENLESRHSAARARTSSLRRQLAETTGDEHAVLLDLGVQPEAAVSGGLLVQTDYRCFLLFNVRGQSVDGRVPQAIVEFKGILKSQFGYPNDEALRGHPLAKSGLDAYDLYEVLNSRWLAEEQRRNQVAFPNYEFSCRHFIATFHDSTFECLASDLSLKVDKRDFRSIWDDLFVPVNES